MPNFIYRPPVKDKKYNKAHKTCSTHLSYWSEEYKICYVASLEKKRERKLNRVSKPASRFKEMVDERDKYIKYVFILAAFCVIWVLLLFGEIS